VSTDSSRAGAGSDANWRDVVVLVRDGKVSVCADGGGAVLPSIWSEKGRPQRVDLETVLHDPAAVPLGPACRTSEGPVRVVHVLSGRAVERPGGQVWLPLDGLSTLDEPADVVEAVRRVLAEHDGTTERPSQRPDWYGDGWLAEVDAWVDERLSDLGVRRTGPTVQLKIWSLSAVVRIPCVDAEGGESDLFSKATCDWFRNEPQITEAIGYFSPEWTPVVLAVHKSRPWMLMRSLPGVDDEPTTDQLVGTARILAEHQLRSLDHLARLRAAGCPDRTLRPTLDGLSMVLSESVELPLLSADELRDVRAAAPRLVAQLEELAGCGLPWTLCHGDLHRGNVAYGGPAPVIYDWTDACIGHPFLDAVVLAGRSEEQERAQVLAAYTETWRAACPGADVERAMQLAPAANRVFEAISYEHIFRAQEPASRWEMSGYVAHLLRRLAA
jgi:aminoglycoside phosphotransferase (APT) family kinase protein